MTFSTIYDKYNTGFDRSLVHETWLDFMGSILKDFRSELPEDFLSHPTIVGTMVVKVFKSKKLNQFDMDALSKLLPDPCICGIEPADYKGISTSVNTISHTAHVMTFLECLPDAKPDSIVEFGGGYGNMCRILKSLWPGVDYTIVDLPLFCALQEIYLDKCGTECNIVPVQNMDSVSDKDMMIATWSLSECDRNVQDQVQGLDFFGSKYFLGSHQRPSPTHPCAGRLREMLTACNFNIQTATHSKSNSYIFGDR